MNKKILLVSLVLLVLVIPHIVSADTLLLYIDDTNQDGAISHVESDRTYTQIRNGAGTSVSLTSERVYSPTIYTSHGDLYDNMARFAMIFNTSKVGSDKVVDSAKLSIYVSSKKNALGSLNYGLTLFSPASNTTLVSGDYDSFLNTRIASDIVYDSISAANINNWTITDNSVINTAGFTRIMLRDNADIENNSSYLTLVAGQNSYLYVGDTSYANSSRRPLLTVVYSAGVSAPVASFTANKNFIRIPNLISVTDTSTNTPTSWQWSWGDGTANSTTQNPSHQYLKRGKFPIVLTATNAGGSGSTSAYNVRVAGYEN